MAIRIALPCALVALFCVSAVSVNAQEGVKEAIFEDCDAARKSFLTLSSQEQEQTFDFLSRIVALNTQTPASPDVFAVMPGQPAGPHLGPSLGRDAAPGHMWQATDAKRELRAKRCALEIFLAAGPAALPALPELIKIYSEQNLSDEVAVALEETAANVAEAAHRAGLLPTESDIDHIVPYLLSEHPLLAQNFLGEFPTIATPRVVKALASVPDESCAAMTTVLQQLDPDGSRGLRAFLEMARSEPNDNVLTLSKRILLPSSPDGLRPYVVDIARLAAEPPFTRATTPLLSRTCIALNDLAIEPSTAADIAQRIDIHTDDILSPSERECLIRALPVLAVRTALEVTSTEEAVVLRTLPLLKSAAPHLVGENRTTVFNRLRDLVLANTPVVSPQAVDAMAFFPDKRSEILTTLLSVLKTPPVKGDATSSLTSLFAAAMKTANIVGLGKEAPRFTPIIVSAVTTGFAFDEARSLAKGHPSLETDLLKILPRSSADTVSRALVVLGDRQSLTSRSIPPLVEVLRSGAHNTEVFTALSKVGTSASGPIRKVLSKGPSPKKITGLSLLVLFQTASKQETSELLSLLASAECSQLPTDPAILTLLENRKDVDRASLATLFGTVGACLPTLSDDLTPRLIEIIPALVPMSCGAATERLGSPQLSQTVATTLAEKFATSSACPAFLEKIVLQGSSQLRAVTLKYLTAAASVDEQVLGAVKDTLNATDSTSDLYFAYATVLAKHAPYSYEWKHLLRDAINSAGKNQPIDQALQVIRFLPPSIVLEEVTPALSSDSPERIVGGCHVGAALGAQAVPIVSKLWNLREKRHPSIRYATSLALLEINPLTPELQDALRQILVNRYFAWALQKPIRWQQTVALVELPKAEFGTLRTVHLERLLTNTATLTPPREVK